MDSITIITDILKALPKEDYQAREILSHIGCHISPHPTGINPFSFRTYVGVVLKSSVEAYYPDWYEEVYGLR